MTPCQPYSLFIKSVGAKCNLDCSYCYYLNNDSQHTLAMESNSVKRVIQNHIESQPINSPVVDFIWHGGEPMLRGLDFYQTALSYQKTLSGKKRIANTIQTNGTLINERWAKFFSKHNFMVGVSIDGPNLINDIGRIDQKGNSSFERTVRGIKHLAAQNVEFNTLSVINNRSYFHGKAIYQFLKDSGSRYMQFQPCIDHELDRRSDYDWSLSGEQWGRFLCDVFDEWCKEDITLIYVQFFENCLMQLMDYPSQMCHHAETCGQQLMMEANGDVFSCDHYGYQEYKLGNSETTSLKSMVNGVQQVEFGRNKRDSLSSQCLTCDFKPLCNGGCPKNRTDKTDNGEPISQLCDGYAMFYRYALPRMLKMVEAMKNGYSPKYYLLF